jgi:hypothetical protein
MHDAALSGNQLDSAARNQQWGQTVGIPIGPDASFILAELVLTGADRELRHRVPTLIGFRHFDDYELAFRDRAAAEFALVALQSTLAEFELSLNHRKTEILELPRPLEDGWASEVAAFSIRPSGRAQLRDLIALFSRVAELKDQYPGEPIVRYLIRRLRAEPISVLAWPTLQNLILTVVTAEPSALRVARATLSQQATVGRHRIALTGLSEVIESIILRHAPLAHGSEVAWCLWAALAFQVQLSASVAAAVAGMEDDIVALLALDADSRNQFPAGTLDRNGWVALVAGDSAHDEHWLLAYEAHHRGWLTAPVMATDPHFLAIRGVAVTFYDPTRAASGFSPALLGAPEGAIAY